MKVSGKTDAVVRWLKTYDGIGKYLKLNAVDMKADMDDMGSMTMTVGMKDKTLNANMAFTVDDGEGSLVKLTMTMDGAYQATSQKPNTQPPAGAQIVDLLGDVEGR